ncbi:MAG: sigma-70 family RNA polymerase sigma factor [Dehalococcoidia bacterium]
MKGRKNAGKEAKHDGTEEQRLPPEEQDALVLQYGPLVRKIAHSMSLTLPGVFDFEDAVAAGNCGLVEAVRRYDPTKGASFYVFATHRIRGAMLDAFRSLDRLSRTMRRRVQNADRVLFKLQGELGRPPTEREVARALGVSLKSYRETVATGRGTAVSLDGLMERDPGRVEAIMSGSVTSPNELIIRLEMKETHEALTKAIGTLPARDQHILALYYSERLTMREIAQILGVSETRISQRHAQMLRRLRAILTPLAA